MISSDVVRTYRQVHSWIGITCGLALFIAFYAGAITMFEDTVRRWAASPSPLPAPVRLAETPTLIAAVLAEEDAAAGRYRVHFEIGPDTPARVTWLAEAVDDDDHSSIPVIYGAAFDESGSLVTARVDVAPVAQLIDVLHQQVGLPFPHEWAMPITGLVALAYVVALVAGIITLLPSLVKDLFALRIGTNLKRMWLDVHNALGVFSLPFHFVMAFTTVVFAFHDQFYSIQDTLIYDGRIAEQWAQGRPPRPESSPDAVLLSADLLVEQIAEQAPGFTPVSVEYRTGPDGSVSARVQGHDARYAMRGPTFGLASIDPYTGRFLETNYLPGHQEGWAAVITSFFTLHFGSFGGNAVRWGYFLLGLAGAIVFYTGNLIWLESHRKRARGGGAVPEQSPSSVLLAGFSVGGALGCIAGISITLAAARWLPELTDDKAAWHRYLFYGVFIGAIAWATLRGAGRGSVELLWFAVVATLLIPLSSVLVSAAHPGGTAWAVDIVAVAGAFCLGLAAFATRKRVLGGSQDSVWSARERPKPVRGAL